MAGDFSAEYASCTPENAVPDFFAYMNAAGERMRGIDPAIRRDAFASISQNYQEWQNTRDKAAANDRDDPRKLQGYVEVISRMRDATVDVLIDSAHKQHKAARKGLG